MTEPIKDSVITAIYEAVFEIISCLCYQPDIPQQHKIDMVNKLSAVSRAYYGVSQGTKEVKE